MCRLVRLPGTPLDKPIHSKEKLVVPCPQVKPLVDRGFQEIFEIFVAWVVV